MTEEYDKFDLHTRELLKMFDSKIEQLTNLKIKEKIIWFEKETELALKGKTKDQIKKEKENSPLHAIEKELNKYKARKKYKLLGPEYYKKYREQRKKRLEDRS